MSEHVTTPPALPAPAHFTAPYAPLADALAIAEFGVQNGVLSPAQRGVLLETSSSSLALTTFDFDTAVTVTLPVDTATTGTSLLDHGQLQKAVAAMVAGETKATAARTAVTVAGDLLTTDHLTLPLPALDLAQFVHPPTAAPTIAVVEAQQLLTQIQRVLPAAGTDDTLPALTGVRMTLGSQTLTLSATDRYRFAVADVPLTDSTPLEDTLSALIPASTLTRLTKRLKAYEGPVALGISDGTADSPSAPSPATGAPRVALTAASSPRVTLTMGTTTVTIRQLEGAQIPHGALFPKNADTSLTIDRATALRALKKCHAMIKAMGSTSSPVTLMWDETGALSLAPRVGTDDEQARTKGMALPSTTISGDTLRSREVSLNPPYLKDALDAFHGDTVTLHLRDEDADKPLKPVLLTAGPDVVGEDYRHLLMPIRIR
ncbi:DNA polymerase III subunit beta family protein [Streptomyces microflavus]|uniref:DNA polymerase III subunit beta family protein n=1 Tax=Streptomyces microflavus TaxID=1919 RepID=UPI0036B52847